MNTPISKMPSTLFHNWQTEDRQLDIYIQDLRGWMKEVNQLGIPHFGEAATRLSALRQRLLEHFHSENEIIASLGEHFPDSDASLNQLQSRSAADHQAMMQRIDSLMERLNRLEPPFESWMSAMKEIEAFVTSLNEHEEEETRHITAMLIAGESRI